MHKSRQIYKPRRRGLRRLFISILILVFVLGAASILVRHVYYDNLHAIGTSSKTQLVTVQTGSSTSDIATVLKRDGLIRNTQVFEWYVRSIGTKGELLAGTYALAPNMSVQQIVNIMNAGKIASNLVTIVPGQRLAQIHDALIKDGFSSSSVDAALNPGLYPNAPILAYKPAGASLEGLLYPDSFERNVDTSPQVIISESLNEMYQHITPDIKNAFAKEGLSVYQGITLASIVEQEVSNSNDRQQVAQVFLSRIGLDTPLGSDVTAYYGALLAGKTPSTTYNSPYNTLLHNGLPPGPISNVSDDSLNAVAHPANTSWLYFVTGDNGITYFSKTAQEHDAQTAQYCHKLCSN